MDSNELHENGNMKQNCSKPIQKNEQKQPEQAIGEDTKGSIQKLNQRNKCIIGKLAKTRQQLQLKKSELEGNSKKTKQNDEKALKSLEFKLPIALNKCTEVVASTSANTYDHSKKHMEAVIEGYERLILNLISNNKRLLNIFGKAAQKISVLRDLPLFENIEKERKISKSAKRAKRHSENSAFSVEGTNQAYPSSLLKCDVRERVEKKSPITSIEKYSKYINKLLREHIGPDQKEILEKYKCLPEHIQDLEPFSNALVQAGYGKILEGEIRINSKNNRHAFITMSDGRETNERDAFISSPLARRYAFDGDIVRAFVLNEGCAANIKDRQSPPHLKEECSSLPLCESRYEDGENELDSANELDNNVCLDNSMNMVSGKENCRKAFVIKIVKQTELREVVGSISFTQTTSINSTPHYKLRPHDMKTPMVFIPEALCEQDLKNIGKEDVCGMLYVARILDISTDGNCIGELVQPVGKVGILQAEIEAILLNNGLKDLKPYEEKYQKMFEGLIPLPSAEDLKNREDLRKKCVFTIDPLTAKDLDDAVSVEKLNDCEYEIGVHISDVSAYLQENSELDNLVKMRSTSVYLVDRVIHMLPTSLCFRCSLLPGEDKFAFSVFWKWHIQKEEISVSRFTRSIINSCSQLAYEHAQKIIDNPIEDLGSDDLPDVVNEWTPNDIKWRVLLLHQIAGKLKAKRYDNGALSINNPKLRFQLDPKSGEPLDFEVEGRREANFLIKELMLLANQSVAKFIHNTFPDKSILRNHPPPLAKSLKSLKERLSNIGLTFNITSSKTISESMQRLCHDTDDPRAVEACLNALLTKPMARAKYFCSEGKTAEADFWHYALSIPIYTHFTSPIRRYADVMVHRLLAAALNYCPPPQRTTDELHQLAKIMNEQKLNAKKAGDDSIELFFRRYLKAKQLITLDAVVTEIGQHALNVVTLETGHSISIAYNLQECVVVTRDVPNSVLICKKFSKLPAKKLQLFSKVKINLALQNDKLFGSFAVFDEPPNNPAVMNCKETSKGDKVLSNKQQVNKANTSTKSKKHNDSKVTEKEKKTKGYLAFYAVKN